MIPRFSRCATFLLCLIAACSPDKITICSLVGCNSGLIVHLATLPAGPFRVEITVRGYDGLTYAVDCSTTSRCGQDVYFVGLTTESAVVTVRIGNRSRSTDIAPVYSTFEPNGPSCPPLCRGATVNVDIPA